jgi:hypothetical protein
VPTNLRSPLANGAGATVGKPCEGCRAEARDLSAVARSAEEEASEGGRPETPSRKTQ